MLQVGLWFGSSWDLSFPMALYAGPKLGAPLEGRILFLGVFESLPFQMLPFTGTSSIIQYPHETRTCVLLGVMAHATSPSPWEAEAGEFL